MKPDHLARAMLDVRQRQAQQRGIRDILGKASDELAAIRKTVHETWGDRAALYALADDAGTLNAGFYHSLDDRHLPPWRRQETIVARFTTHAELVVQIATWRRSLG